MDIARDTKVDFFVSHAGADAAWAAWIDQTLRGAAFSTITDLYDFGVGRNFILLMEDALQRANRLLLVWSPNAMRRYMVEAEWTSVLAAKRDRVIPVLVEPCEKPIVLASTLHIDLTAFSDAALAGEELVRRLRGASRPDAPVEFPGHGVALTEPPPRTNDRSSPSPPRIEREPVARSSVVIGAGAVVSGSTVAGRDVRGSAR